jgi:plastocyanin
MRTPPHLRPAVARRARWRAAIVGAAVLIAAIPLSACSSTAAATVAPASGLPTPVPPTVLATLPPAKPARPAEATNGPAVSIENFNFVPAEITVPAGATIVWTNHDDVEHTVTASDNGFGSPSIQTDGQFSYTFAKPGTYTYFCAIHPFMTAKVIVQ